MYFTLSVSEYCLFCLPLFKQLRKLKAVEPLTSLGCASSLLIKQIWTFDRRYVLCVYYYIMKQLTRSWSGGMNEVSFYNHCSVWMEQVQQDLALLLSRYFFFYEPGTFSEVEVAFLSDNSRACS